jgi:unsaturated rhamnogalacturonyl hydrolase
MRSIDVLAANRRVIDYVKTHPDERDCWEKAPAITGALEWDDTEAVAAVQGWIDRAVETQTSNGDLNYCEPVDLPAGHVKSFTSNSVLSASLGYPLLKFYERTGDSAYLEAAHRQVEALLRTPRTTEGGFWARKEGPELWVDFLYMMCPFLLLHAKITGERSNADEAFNQYAVYVRHLVDPYQGLARHAWCESPNSYPQSTFWARGTGWLVCSSMDMLEICGDHAQASLVRKTVVRALTAVAGKQDRSGFLRHVLDDPDARFEASATLMFAHAAARAAQMKLVDESFFDRAERAIRVVAGSVDASGAVLGVAVPPGGPGVPFGTTLFGQGFFMHAAHALRDRL